MLLDFNVYTYAYAYLLVFGVCIRYTVEDTHKYTYTQVHIHTYKYIHIYMRFLQQQHQIFSLTSSKFLLQT